MNEITEATIIFSLFGVSWLLGWPFIMEPIIGTFWMLAGFPFYPILALSLIKLYYCHKSHPKETEEP